MQGAWMWQCLLPQLWCWLAFTFSVKVAFHCSLWPSSLCFAFFWSPGVNCGVAKLVVQKHFTRKTDSVLNSFVETNRKPTFRWKFPKSCFVAEVLSLMALFGFQWLSRFEPGKLEFRRTTYGRPPHSTGLESVAIKWEEFCMRPN